MFYGSFFPWVCSSPGLCGLIYLGTNSACDLSIFLANSCPGKISLLFSPMKLWLRMGCWRVPARGIAKAFLVRIRTAALFNDCPLLGLQAPNLHWSGKFSIVPSCVGLQCVCPRLQLNCLAPNLTYLGVQGWGGAEAEILSQSILVLGGKLCVKAPVVDNSTASVPCHLPTEPS